MLRLITAATAEPVSLAEAKLHLRTTSTARDTLISTFITAAREEVEQKTGYGLADAVWEWTPVCPRDELPILPAAITSAEDVEPITFKVAPGPAPAALKAAILLRVADLVAHAEAGTAEPLGENPAFDSLIFPFRRVRP